MFTCKHNHSYIHSIVLFTYLIHSLGVYNVVIFYHEKNICRRQWKRESRRVASANTTMIGARKLGGNHTRATAGFSLWRNNKAHWLSHMCLLIPQEGNSLCHCSSFSRHFACELSLRLACSLFLASSEPTGSIGRRGLSHHEYRTRENVRICRG